MLFLICFLIVWGSGSDFCENIHLSVSAKNMPDFLVAFAGVLPILVSCVRNELTAVYVLSFFTRKYQQVKV